MIDVTAIQGAIALTFAVAFGATFAAAAVVLLVHRLSDRADAAPDRARDA